MKNAEPFEYSGLAMISDLQTSQWKDLFNYLLEIQTEFSKHADRIFSKAYPWPQQPLFKWSRLWEYPFVLHHVRRYRGRKASNSSNERVLDLGSGLTFFPYAIAREGFEVIATDIDPICRLGYERANRYISAKPGEVRFLQSQANKVPLEDGECSLIYCISVLEHVEPLPTLEALLAGMARVLKNDGLLIVTFDLGLDGLHEILPGKYQSFRRVFENHFESVYPELRPHPFECLLSVSSPYPVKEPVGFQRSISAAKEFVKSLMNLPKTRRPVLACEAFVCRKRRR